MINADGNLFASSDFPSQLKKKLMSVGIGRVVGKKLLVSSANLEQFCMLHGSKAGNENVSIKLQISKLQHCSLETHKTVTIDGELPALMLLGCLVCLRDRLCIRHRRFEAALLVQCSLHSITFFLLDSLSRFFLNFSGCVYKPL